MNNKLQEWIFGGATLAGVVGVQEGDRLGYRVCLLKKEKEQATIVAQHNDLLSIDALQELLGKEIPILLGINMKGILNRVLDYRPNSTEEALSAVFPSAQEEDFYCQYRASGNRALVSVVRKDRVANLLKELETASLWVVHVSIGPFVVQEVLSLLPATVEQIPLGPQVLHLEGQQVVALSKSSSAPPPVYTIGEDAVPASLLLPLALAFTGLSDPTHVGLEIPAVLTRRADFYYKRLFHYTAIGLLGFFFITLLGNYLLFDHYQKKQQNLSLEVAQQQSLLDQRDKLAQQYADKKAFLGDQWSLGQSKASYYADQLAATLPSTLQLTRLVLFPLLEEKGYDPEVELPRYDGRRLLVEGRCQASVFYNNWKRSLAELDWVASIHNLHYQNDQDGQGLFRLEITLAND